MPSEHWFGLLIHLSVRTSTACHELMIVLSSNPSPTDGRRSIYLWGMPILCVGSCGVALSTSFQSLLLWRFVQTFGCAGPLSLGAGVIGDIYKLGERGTFIGLFFGVRDHDDLMLSRFGTDTAISGHTSRVRCCPVCWR